MNVNLEKAAILGGQPVRREPWPEYNTIGEEEKREVMETLDCGVLSAFHASPGDLFYGGPKVRKLEEAWKQRFGVKHAVSMNSATSALQAAVAACGIGPGDEVILNPLTMSATAAVVMIYGAVPVYADVDPHAMNLDPDSVAQCITPRTRAIYATHLAGLCTDMDPLMELARAHDLFVLEDNAQAPGALYKGSEAGTIGDIGIYSLNCHKTIQAGEGGIAVTNDDDLAHRLRLVRNHGEKLIDAMGDGGRGPLLGFNFRMTEMEAAVGIHQLAKLDKLNGWNRRLADYLNAALHTHFGEDLFLPTPVPENQTHVYYFYHMEYFADRAGLPLELFAKAVRAEGIPLYERYPMPLYRQSLYQKRNAYAQTGMPFQPPWSDGSVSYAGAVCPQAEALADRSLFLETIVRWPNQESDMDDVIAAFDKVLRNRDELLARAEELEAMEV